MHPLFFVSVFLIIFALLTSHEMQKYEESSYIEKMILETIAMQEEKELLLENAYFKELKAASKEVADTPSPEGEPLKPKPYNYKLVFDIYRPPNNARLNLYQLVMEREEERKVVPLRTLFINLLYKLYKNEPFFQEIPNFPEKLLEQLYAHKEAIIFFRTPDELSCLEFQDPLYTEILHKMLKGDTHYPSLLQFLSFHNKIHGESSKINLLFASEEILSLIFPEKIFQKLIKMRSDYWEEIWLQEEGTLERGTLKRAKLKKEFRERVLELLENEGIDKNFITAFDFSLGKSGSTLQYIDPHTGMLVREHI